MALLLRIFLSFNILLLCGGFNSFYPFSSADASAQTTTQGSIRPDGYTSSAHNDVRLKPLSKGKYLRKLLATEFEDDTDEVSAQKKHSQKADLLAGHFFSQQVCYSSYAVARTLRPGKLPHINMPDKLYLRIQVFRI